MGFDPDWTRAGVSPPDAYEPVGDPTRWGARIVQDVPMIGGVQQVLQSQQLLSVQCRDDYSRPWSIIGTLSANASLWAFPEAPGPLTWSAILSVTMGVASNQIVHNINLRATVTADAPFYFESQPGYGIFAAGGQNPERAFLIPGSIVANAIAIRVIHVVEYVLAPIPPGDRIITSLQLTAVTGVG